MERMIFIKLLFLMNSHALAEEFERIAPQIKNKYIIASTMCYLEKIDQRGSDDCRPVIKLAKKKEMTKNLNRQTFCHQVISNYVLNLMPAHCKAIYCTPCLYRETIS